ncbi:MAG: response regulator transcription factor [Chitinophagaceae bacterium]
MEKTTILVTEDHVLVRESWTHVLNADPRFSVIGDCGSGEEAVELAGLLHPDIVIMDINLPGISGIEATSQVLKNSPQSKVICVSMHNEPSYARKMMQNGAMGYITKTSSGEEMATAIFEVSENRKYICQDIKDNLTEQMINPDEQSAGLDALSKRQLEIIGWVTKGMKSKEIAIELDISVKTVEVHRYNILKKLKLKNVAAMVNFMNQAGSIAN